jgi:hypothetical protein
MLINVSFNVISFSILWMYLTGMIYPSQELNDPANTEQYTYLLFI